MFRGLSQKVYDLTGINVYLCHQCGICSGSCPLVKSMDIPPNMVVRMVQMDMNEVLNSKTIWICASCFNCTVRCPRNIDPARIINALRIIKQREGVYAVDLRKIEKLEELPQIALIAASRKLTG
ncbi:MAG: 4Fe-4S dicluster domain-containing protein [archaeon GB-1845-036]|nr:4Fe-4S dicluster domain-containing protein [Candidatus Culexmicrobium thermophilum]RLE56515.1 MAG: heterodisulfide reductase [Candidatus Verstraetearchaeota archaeon]HDO21146.1 4Fe-4S dicluster domain-containing protein [Candidatus Bathyarchaeota archaeon]